MYLSYKSAHWGHTCKREMVFRVMLKVAQMKSFVWNFSLNATFLSPLFADFIKSMAHYTI